MANTLEINRASVDYESWYHTQRHATHFNDSYYNARSKIALGKFFSGIDTNARLLDFGCGLGQNIFQLPNAEGYDISEFGVEFCRRKGIKATSYLFEIPDEYYEVVFSAHVLEHHPHPKTMLEDIHRKLVDGGTLLLVIPYEKHGKAKFSFDLNQHLYTWNFQAINNLLLMSGFKILKNKYIHGAGYNRLLPLANLSFKLYQSATVALSRVAGIREMMVVAKKV